jgi:hypothetical protein
VYSKIKKGAKGCQKVPKGAKRCQIEGKIFKIVFYFIIFILKSIKIVKKPFTNREKNSII